MCNHGRIKPNCGCDCGCHGGTWRQYRTRDEKRSRLEEYRDELRQELQAVEEKLQDFER